MEKYRPSNGTEGDSFIATYCEKCIYYQDGVGCPILFATMLYDKDDTAYPPYWVETDEGPECTLWEEKE